MVKTKKSLMGADFLDWEDMEKARSQIWERALRIVT